jgi:hypothetical protein
LFWRMGKIYFGTNVTINTIPERIPNMTPIITITVVSPGFFLDWGSAFCQAIFPLSICPAGLSDAVGREAWDFKELMHATSIG